LIARLLFDSVGWEVLVVVVAVDDGSIGFADVVSVVTSGSSVRVAVAMIVDLN
jgi:hypothetical protein